MTSLPGLQTSSTRADALFARLAETTARAVKTRERLFDELKTELELALRLQHDHLLPALKRHAGTKTVVAETADRLAALKAALRRLDKAPQDGDAFLAEAADLHAQFRQHLREEKSDLLPKMRKALSEEELRIVGERIEADRAEVEAGVRHDAEEHRAEVRREREQEEAREAAVEAEAREGRRLERERKVAAQALRREAHEVAELVSSAAEPVAGAARALGETTRSFAALAGSGGFTEAAQQVSREWTGWLQTRTQNQLDGFGAMMRCRTPMELISVQSQLLRKDVELLLDTGARMSSIAAPSAPD